MTKKRLIIITTIFLVLFILLIGYFVLTRQTYWRNNYPQSQYLEQSDADYLETWDLRLLSTNDDDYLLDLGEKICSSANTSGMLDNEHMDIISENNYKKIKYCNRFPMELAKKCDYSITETDVLSKNNKAVFFCRDKYTGFDADGKKVFGGENSSFPLRIYFEKENGTWKVKGISVPL